jgi:MFS family permease
MGTFMTKRGATVLRNVSHGVNDIFWFILPSLLPVILEQFDMKYGTAGGLLASFLVVIAAFSFVLGRLSDRVPRQLILGIGFLVASVFLIFSSFAEKYGLFVAFLLLAGIGVGSYHPTVYAHIDETTAYRQGREYGMFELWGASGIFLMFLLHGFLLRQMSWKSVLFITSVPGLVVGFFFLCWLKPLRALQGAEMGKSRAVMDDGGGGASTLLFALFLLVVTLRFFSIVAVVSFTTTYLVREIGLHSNVASFATGVYFLGGLVFTPFLGRVCDVKNPFVVLLAATAAAFPLIVLLSLPHPLWLLPLYLVLLGGAYYGAGPAMNMLISRMGGNMGKGEAFGYFMAITAVTYSFSPFVFGLFADRIGLALTMRVFSLPLLLSFVVLCAVFFIAGAEKTRASSRLSP